MKLTALLLTICAIHVMARSTAQTISYRAENVPLKQVFTEIERQTGYVVMFNAAKVSLNQPVSIHAKREPLEKFLNNILDAQGLQFSIIKKTIVVSPKEEKKPVVVNSESLPPLIEAEPIDVKGIVRDEAGKPAVGIAVRVKGSNKGTTTNDNGEFSLMGIEENTILVFSSVNTIEQEIKITRGKASNIMVSLKLKINKLEDFAITSYNNGYQKLPKERQTGSFTQVENALLNEQVGTNILDRLEYIANGYTVSRAIKTSGQPMIRGLSTLQGPKDPLVVLDNFPYNGSLDNINPNDVESITLLKDAAAASIWGARAGNGVVVITSKRSRFNSPLKVSFNSSITSIDPPDLMAYKRMNPSDLVDVEQLLFSKGYRFSDTASSSKVPFSQVYEILFRQRKGQITQAETNSLLEPYRNHDVRKDFLDLVYQKALNQQYALSLSGGSDKFNWLLGGGYDQNVSDLSAKYRRLTLRSENNVKISKNINFSAGLNIVSSESKAGRTSFSDITTVRGGFPLYSFLADDNGNPVPVLKDYRETYTDTAGAGKLLNWKYYPVEDYKHIDNTTKISDIVMNLGLTWNIDSRFSIDIKYQYEQQQTNGRNNQDVNSYFTRDWINRYSQINRSTGIVTYKVPLGGILDQSFSTIKANHGRAQLNFNTRYGLHHQINAIAGAEIRDVRTLSNRYRVYGYDDEILTTSVVDYANPYPSIVTGSSGLIPMASSINNMDYRFISLYFNGSYTYRSRYTATVSLRRDASNTFGVATNDKWTPLWSTGLSWDLIKEKWFPLSTFSTFKLRTTYGVSGNVDPSKTAMTTISYASNNPYTQSPYATIDRFYNPDLRWERSAMWNIGIDFSAIKNRLSGSIEYYIKKGSDLYGTSLIDYTVGLGFPSIIKNVASMSGSGVDFEVNSLNTTGKLKWQTQFILNYNTNKVTNYYLTSKQGSSYVGGGFTPIEGTPVNSIYAYKWGGLDPANGDPIGIVAGQPTKMYSSITGTATQISDLAYIGPAVPTFSGSLGNTISWKGLQLSFRFTYKFGNYFLRSTIDYAGLLSAWRTHPDYYLRWQQPGDEARTNVPSFSYPLVTGRESFYKGSEIMAEKGDNIRFQYLSLQYNLPVKVKSGSGPSFTIFTTLNNIGIVWRANNKKIDPDYGGEQVSPPRVFSVGARCQF